VQTASSRAGSSLPLMQERNSSGGRRVLLESPCRTRRTVNCRSILEEASSFEPWGQHLSVGGGAILTFAVDVTTSGFNLNTVGIILMVAGALGLVVSLLFWSSFSPYRRAGP
jgi:hypothetical protein